MGELGKLIAAASRANRGRSMQAAADLATQRGAPISKSRISASANKVDSLTPQLIRGISAGYDIPLEDVARAVLADLGFAITDYNPTPESAIRRDPDLSSEARAMLLAAIDAARAPSRAARDGISDEAQDSRGVDRKWLPTKDPGVSRRPGDDRRGELGSG